MPLILLENIHDVLAGEVPQFVCNPDAVEGWRSRWCKDA
jgi:hypothetical protein